MFSNKNKTHKICIRYLLVSILVVLWFPGYSLVFSASITELFPQYAFEFQPEGSVSYEYPDWARPDASQSNDELSYWVHTVLPYEQDKQASMYLVIPKAGIVMPVLRPSLPDKHQIDAGVMFNHYPYLEQGSLWYYGTKNKVIAAHSSYKASDPGRYKTAGQAFVVLRPSDKVFFYYKNDIGTFDFAEYTVIESARTTMDDISITEQDSTYYMLTAYSCYPLGSNDDRRYIQAKLSNEIANHSDLNSAYAYNNDLAVDEEQEHTSAPEKQEITDTDVSIIDTYSEGDENEPKKQIHKRDKPEIVQKTNNDNTVEIPTSQPDDQDSLEEKQETYQDSLPNEENDNQAVTDNLELTNTYPQVADEQGELVAMRKDDTVIEHGNEIDTETTDTHKDDQTIIEPAMQDTNIANNDKQQSVRPEDIDAVPNSSSNGHGAAPEEPSQITSLKAEEGDDTIVLQRVHGGETNIDTSSGDGTSGANEYTEKQIAIATLRAYSIVKINATQLIEQTIENARQNYLHHFSKYIASTTSFLEFTIHSLQNSSHAKNYTHDTRKNTTLLQKVIALAFK